MEDVTDPSFRILCKEFGADIMYTEFISADGLIRGGKKGLKKLEILDKERPVGIQIYGHETDSMVAAAKIAEKANPDILDINFGCPVRKIATRGAGSGMLRNIPKLIEITQKVVESVSVPVTVKTRLGWDSDSINILEVAEQLNSTGILLLTVHGRTRAQMYTGNADWTLIGKLKANPKINLPIVGNGDIDSPEKALEAFNIYKVDGVMIGRASIGQPWIFRDVKHFLANGEKLSPLTIKEKTEVAIEHLARSVEWKSEWGGVITMRRHYVQYFKKIPDFREMKIKLLTSNSVEENIAILKTIASKYGDLVV